MGNGMPDRNNSANEHVWVEERLSAYIDDQLNPLERAQLERHLRDCARCQASLASLRWTVSLVKQAPAPALPRQFTLPLPAATPSTRRAPAFGFGLARLATVVATLLLFAVVTVDLLTRLGGGFAASAPAPAALRAVEPTSVALAPSSADETKRATPTASPERLLAVPPAPIAPTLTSPEVTGGGSAASETPSPKFATQNAVGTRTVQRTQPVSPRASATPTVTIAANAPSAALAGTATQTPEARATATPPTVVEARVQPTAAPLPSRPEVATSPLAVSPLRVAEIGLFFFMVFFGALTVMLWRRR